MEARGARDVRRWTSYIQSHCPAPRSSNHIGYGNWGSRSYCYTRAVPEVRGDEIQKLCVCVWKMWWILVTKFCQFSPGNIGLTFVTDNFTTFFTARKEVCHLELTLVASSPNVLNWNFFGAISFCRRAAPIWSASLALFSELPALRSSLWERGLESCERHRLATCIAMRSNGPRRTAMVRDLLSPPLFPERHPRRRCLLLERRLC